MASDDTCRIRYTVYTSTDSVTTFTREGFYIIGEPVYYENTDNNLPEEFELFQNYPNPFNPSTNILFVIGSSYGGSFVTLKVYDVIGNEVATLVNEYKPAGTYEVQFNGIDFPSGVYFYKLHSGNYTAVKKMILTK